MSFIDYKKWLSERKNRSDSGVQDQTKSPHYDDSPSYKVMKLNF